MSVVVKDLKYHQGDLASSLFSAIELSWMTLGSQPNPACMEILAEELEVCGVGYVHFFELRQNKNPAIYKIRCKCKLTAFLAGLKTEYFNLFLL